MKTLITAILVLGLSGCQMMTEPSELEAARTGSEMETVGPTGGEADERAPLNGVLRTDRQSYPAGSTATIVLENDTNEALGENLCFSVLEQGFNTGWRDAPHQADEICTSELRVLQHGETSTWEYRLDARLAPGLYRFRTTVEVMRTGDRVDAISNTFEVTR